jgi:hypothetical protein
MSTTKICTVMFLDASATQVVHGSWSFASHGSVSYTSHALTTTFVLVVMV